MMEARTGRWRHAVVHYKEENIHVLACPHRGKGAPIPRAEDVVFHC